jgi:hypothetical protein
MANEVAIANRALTKIGDARITSLADNVESARVISSSWDAVLDNELRLRNWNFSIARTSLPLLVDSPAWGFSYQYQMPSDCLRIIQVGEYYPGLSLTNYRAAPDELYQIEGGKILSDLGAPLKIKYVARIENSGLWDASFVEVFACRMAMEICERRTESSSKYDRLRDAYKEAVRIAARSDAIENPPQMLPDDSWMMSRL